MKHVGVKRRRSQAYEDFNVSTFPFLGIWSLSGFHKFGIGFEGSKPCSNWAFFKTIGKALKIKKN